MQHPICNRFTGAPLFTAEIDCAPRASHAIRLGLAVKRAIEARASLADADLRGVSLRGADLTRVDLIRADLRGADLRGARLTGADLAGASLAGANLRDANVINANLRCADLTRAIGTRAMLVGPSPILQIAPIGREGDVLIAEHDELGVVIRRGGFIGTIEEFRRAHVESAVFDGQIYVDALALVETWAREQASRG